MIFLYLVMINILISVCIQESRLPSFVVEWNIFGLDHAKIVCDIKPNLSVIGKFRVIMRIFYYFNIFSFTKISYGLNLHVKFQCTSRTCLNHRQQQDIRIILRSASVCSCAACKMILRTSWQKYLRNRRTFSVCTIC